MYTKPRGKPEEHWFPSKLLFPRMRDVCASQKRVCNETHTAARLNLSRGFFQCPPRKISLERSLFCHVFIPHNAARLAHPPPQILKLIISHNNICTKLIPFNLHPHVCGSFCSTYDIMDYSVHSKVTSLTDSVATWSFPGHVLKSRGLTRVYQKDQKHAAGRHWRRDAVHMLKHNK
jgi:hypothetical protein